MGSFDVNMDLVWKCKGNSKGSHCSNDVAIRVYNNNSGKKRLSFNFDVTCKEIVFGNADFMAYAILKNRIYFRPAGDRDGYSFSEKNKHTTRVSAQARIEPEDLEIMESFVGDYKLQEDVYRELWYIENENISVKKEDK